MIIQEVIGNVANIAADDRKVDLLQIEWFESAKKILRKQSDEGIDLAIKFLREGQRLHGGDILFEDATKRVVVYIKPCDAIVIQPQSLLEMGTVCYEIGNKHLPVFIQDNQVLIPFEDPLYKWLEAGGYKPKKEKRQLLNLLKSNISPHGHEGTGTSLFNRIINLAAKA